MFCEKILKSKGGIRFPETAKSSYVFSMVGTAAYQSAACQDYIGKNLKIIFAMFEM